MNLKSGSLRIPRFVTKGRINKLHEINKTDNRGFKIIKIAKQMKTVEDGNVMRLRQMAKMNMACTSLFNEMKAATGV